jgi:hypothetical protein
VRITGKCLTGCRALLSTAFVLLAAAPAHACYLCVGDCDGDHRIAINELVTGVSIVLGTASLDACPPIDCNCSERPRVLCLVQAVGNALSGPCEDECGLDPCGQNCDQTGCCSEVCSEPDSFTDENGTRWLCPPLCVYDAAQAHQCLLEFVANGVCTGVGP